MSKLENLTAYTVVEKKELKEVNGYGYILSHNKTKARVAVIENDDTNKVFTIGFRTASRRYRCAAYHGAFGSLWFQKISGQGSVRGALQRKPEYILKCNDLFGQDSISACKSE